MSSTSTSLTYIDKNRLSPYKIAEIAAVGALMAGIYALFGTFEHLWMEWNSPSIDRTYNMLIPVFSLIFIWLKWRRLKTVPIKATYWGLPLVLFGTGVRMLGEPGQVNFVKYCSLVFVLGGAIWTVFGTKMFAELLFPIAFLIFMMPVPDPIYQRMSVPMQDFAAKAGFAVTRVLGIDATLTGRLIKITALDPPMDMSVAEACSGMKSLLTLGAVAVAFAYITRRDLLTRVILSLCSVPIAIGMNMLRVAGVGVLAVTLGREWASGLYHEGQGVVFYIVEIVILFLVGTVISWVFGKPAVEWGRSQAGKVKGEKPFPYSTRLSVPAIVCAALLILFYPALYTYHEQVKHLSEGVEPKIAFEKFTNHERDLYVHKMTTEFAGFFGTKKTVKIDMDLSTDGIQYVGFEQEIRNDVLRAAEVDSYLNIAYFECPAGSAPDAVEQVGNYVLGYVAFHKSASSGINRGAIHYPDQCYPGNGFQTASTGVVTIETPGYCGGRTEMARSVFYNADGAWILVYYHMNNNGRSVLDRSVGKIDNFMKLLLGQRTGFLAQVQFYTVVGQGRPERDGIDEAAIDRAEERLKRFCPVFLLKLGRHLPDPVK